MITRVFIFTLALMGLSQCSADTDINDYVYWKKVDISAWHMYFPSRYLDTERQTNDRATAAAMSVGSGMYSSLTSLLRYQKQELETALTMMSQTSAQGCLRGISGELDNVVTDATATYQDCAADVVPKLQRLSNTWTNNFTKYQSTYESTLNGIQNCATTYSNKNSWSRLKSCVNTYTNNYFSVANSTINSISSSPSMAVFTSTIVGCAESAAQTVISKGWLFLGKLVQCSMLSGNDNWQTYESELISGFNSTLNDVDLASQIASAQNNFIQLQSRLEQQMIIYYDLQKSALEQYVIASRGEGFYWNEIHGELSNYFSSVYNTLSDNPSDSDCTSVAQSRLYDIVNSGSEAALECDQKIVNDTKHLIEDTNQDFSLLNLLIPSVGNPSILSCFSEGYIYMEQTISKCSALYLAEFTVTYNNINADIIKNVATLHVYERIFYANATLLPCGDSILPPTISQAERALYNLERCVYINDGTKYAEITTTTPLPN